MKTFNLQKYPKCYFKVGNYRNNNSLAVFIHSTEEGPITPLSINIWNSMFLEEDEFFVPTDGDYGDLTVIADELVDQKLLKKSGEITVDHRIVYFGYKITEKAAEYSVQIK